MKKFVVVTLGGLLMAPQLLSQPSQPVGRERPGVMKRWANTLKTTSELLDAEEWKRARRTVNNLLTEMCDRIEGGKGVARLIANATFLRSLAESGLGNEAVAYWDYSLALTLAPVMSEIDLLKYGKAGERLNASVQNSPPPSADWPGEDIQKEDPEGPDTVKIGPQKPEQPKKIHSPAPKYPYGKLTTCADGPIKVLFIIGKDGHPKHPQLLTEQDPLLGYAALDALREWRFKPAELDGEPVEVYYNLTVNFKLPICTNLFARAKKAKEKQ